MNSNPQTPEQVEVNCQYASDCRIFQAYFPSCYLSEYPDGKSSECAIHQIYSDLDEKISDAERNHLIPTDEDTPKFQRGWRL